MSDMADVIGRKDEATEYRSQFKQTQSAFIGKYLRDDGTLAIERQSACALALTANLIPEGFIQSVGDQLAQLIANEGNLPRVGFLEHQYYQPCVRLGIMG